MTRHIYNKETGESICQINYDNHIFIGKAFCHPEDEDVKSAITGPTIAEARAELKKFKHIRNETIIQLKALNHLWIGINNSKKVNIKDYSYRRLQSEVQRLKNQLTTANNEIADLKQFLKAYIAKKEAAAQKYRLDKNK